MGWVAVVAMAPGVAFRLKHLTLLADEQLLARTGLTRGHDLFQ
jgi:hypothetical protein